MFNPDDALPLPESEQNAPHDKTPGFKSDGQPQGIERYWMGKQWAETYRTERATPMSIPSESEAERPMTEDELEANGYPRNYHEFSFEERRRFADERALKHLQTLGAVPAQPDIATKLFEDTSEYNKDNDRYLKQAKLAVLGSYNSTHEVPDQLEDHQLYIVWFVKVLEHWKALISTTVPGDRLYFEVTHNGSKLETYVDTYRKEDNQVFSHHNQ